MKRTLYQLATFACWLLTWGTAAVAAAVHAGMQESSSAAAAAGVLSPHVTAVVLPTPGSSFEGATDAAHTTALGLSAFSSSLIMVLPTPPDAESSSSASKQPGDTQLPLQLQHDITWTDDASAALNAAASIAHATGAAWLFVAVAGDIVTVQDGALLLQQLQHSCKSEQVLACHSNLQESWAQLCFFKLPLQGQFEGPVQPIYIPNNNTSNSSSSDSRSITGQQAEQVIADCPPGVRPDRLTLSGILYQQATPNFAQLRSNVALLRQHLSTRPPHAAWWHLQLSAAFESLGNTQHAQQHLDAAYDAATSRRLAAAAMYTLATMRLTAGDPEGAVAAAARGIARHVTPDLLWIAALASYRADDFRAAVAWGEMAVQLACGAGTCSIDRPAAFVDVSNWYEKPHDVLRWPYRTYKPAGCEEAAAKAERAWAAAAALRKRQVVGNSSSMFVVLGLQALPLLELQGDDEDAFEPPSTPTKPRIASSITTAHRPDFFRRSWHSFQARCLDCHDYVTAWYAVDDGSSAEVFAQMQQAAPPCTVRWLEKEPQQAGHVGSLNRILQEVLAHGYDYLLHLEDDWYFTTDTAFVTQALRIMDYDASIVQVLFNQDYADTDAAWEREHVSAGQQRITLDGLPYVLHVYGGPEGSPELAAYVQEHAGNKLSSFHWPGFSLRPGLWRLSAIKQIGQFEAGVQFEHAFGLKLHATGYRVAFLPGAAAVHLAPTATWLQERQADMDAVYARHGLQLRHTPGHQRSAYDANVAWR